MKKTLAILILLTMSLFMFACSNNGGTTNKFIEFKDDEVLYVGSNMQFMNYEDEVETVRTLTYTKKTTYELRRTYYLDSNSVEYNGYYYYWTRSTVSDEEELGKMITKYTYEYSYLPYGSEEDLIVKTKVTEEKSFDFEGGWIEKKVENEFQLNNYFESINDLKQKCPKLYEKLDLKENNKFYIDTDVPTITASSNETYTTYYYIEKK